MFVHLKYFEGLGKLPFSEVENMFSLNFKILPDASEMARKVEYFYGIGRENECNLMEHFFHQGEFIGVLE